MILSKTFDTLNKTLTDLYFSLSRSTFFLKKGLTSASFKSSGKHPSSKDTLMIFVIIDSCIPSVTLSMSGGMFPTGVALETSILKITCRRCCFITCWKKTFYCFHKFF